mgnify:CR=1 FL=1
MHVELIDHLGTDLTVVNAARVSFNKEHSEIEPGDQGLIKYLAKHKIAMDKLVKDPTEDKKQGSGRLSPFNREANLLAESVYKFCGNAYHQLLGMGICEEQARAVLPQSMLTEWFWSGSLYAFSRVCNLRNTADAQQETKNISLQIDKICSKLFPYSWKALTFNYDIGEG